MLLLQRLSTDEVARSTKLPTTQVLACAALASFAFSPRRAFARLTDRLAGSTLNGMRVTYRERDLPERLAGREYPMEDNTEQRFVATVLSNRPVAPGLIEYELEVGDEAHAESLHFVDVDEA
jgi:hypothetical protein